MDIRGTVLCFRANNYHPNSGMKINSCRVCMLLCFYINFLVSFQQNLKYMLCFHFEKKTCSVRLRDSEACSQQLCNASML